MCRYITGPYGNVYSSHKKALASVWICFFTLHSWARVWMAVPGAVPDKKPESRTDQKHSEFKVRVFSLWLSLSLYGCNHLYMCMPFLFFFFGKHAGLVKPFLKDRLSFNVHVCLSSAKEKLFQVPLKCV